MTKILHSVIISALSLTLLGCSTTETLKDEPIFSVSHKLPTGQYFSESDFRFMTYYRTEVKNLSDKPIQIVTFEGYSKYGDNWYPNNITGGTLTSEDFTSWYSDGDSVVDGIIQPHETAVCDVNWHGSDENSFEVVKWSYTVRDSEEKKHYLEAEVKPENTVVVGYLKN